MYSRYLIVSATLLLAACGNKDISGTYYGQLTVKKDGIVTAHAIEADVKGTTNQFTLALLDRETKASITNVAASTQPVQRTLTIKSKIFGKLSQIRLVAAGSCGASSNAMSYDAELCAASGVITLSYEDKTQGVFLQAFQDPGEVTTIKPGIYTIPQLAELAKKQNLDVLLKAQEVYRAREEVLLRRGNLFPNFNLGTILSAIESPFGLLSQVGNLMPFLFPDNWYRLSASKDMKRAEELSYQSLKANQVNIVSGIAYMILKDQAMKSSIQTHVADHQEMLDIVKMLVANGQAPSSWEKIVEMQIIDDEEDLIAFEKFLSEQMIGLEKLLGSAPTKPGITLASVVLPTIDTSLIKVLAAEEAMAIAKSPELKSTVSLEAAAQKLTQAAMWSWLNPNTDPRFNMGLGLEHAVKIEKSHIKDIQLKRKSADNTLRGNILDIERGVKFLVDQYNLADKGEKAAKDGLKVALKQFEAGQLGLLDTLQFAEQHFKYRTKKVVAQFTYLILMDKLNRHILTGTYADLPLPKPPKEETL